MLLTTMPRLDLVKLLPRAARRPEIGVAEGNFARHILRTVAPERYHLIDPGEHQTREDYKTDAYGNVAADVQESRFPGRVCRLCGRGAVGPGGLAPCLQQ